MQLLSAYGAVTLSTLAFAEPSSAAAPAVESSDTDIAPGAPESKKTDPAAEKFWRAVKLLESKEAADLATGRKFLQESSDEEFTHAQTLLGNCHMSGSYGFPKDPKKAANLFRLAAERGNAFARISLGTCYATGKGMRRDDEKAAEWLNAALLPDADFSRPAPPADFFRTQQGAESGVAGELESDPVGSAQATAHFLLGQIYARAKKPAEAQAHYVAAASAGVNGKSGIFQAAVEAAINYAFGRGIPRDPAKANEMLERSKQLNQRLGVSLIHNYVSLKMIDEFAVADIEEELANAGAGAQATVQIQIALTLADKKSKDYRPAEAAQWYELAANNGQSWGMVLLGLMYANGELGTADPGKAFQWFEKAGGGDKPKNLLGVANLAICLTQGFGTTKDAARAEVLFKKYKNSDIACYLGTIGQCPLRPLNAEEERRLNETWAKEKSDPQAQFLLGMRYLSGHEVTANPAEAERWLKKAAKAKHGGALCELGWLYQVFPGLFGFDSQWQAARASVECYKASSNALDVGGMVNYANAFNTGFGVEKNQGRAIELYEKCLAIDPSHAIAHSNLAKIYRDKLVSAAKGESSSAKAEWTTLMLEHYQAALHGDEAFGAAGLGELYYAGQFVPQDFAKAYAYFEQASEVPRSKAAAQYHLGYMHEFGQSVPVTYTEAAYHYRIAALEGNVLALRRLIDFYVTGTGVSLDFDRAIYWLNYMIRLGQLDALPTLADLLLKKKDWEHAIKLLNALKRADNAGISGYAYERLSLCYEYGEGVERNPKRAEKCLKIAIDKNNSNALARLADRQFSEGKNNEAVATYIRAAEKSSIAAYHLGQMYFFGTNVEKDRPKALKYLRDSASGNCRDALYFLAGLTWNLEPNAPTLDEAIEFARKAETLGLTKAGELRDKLEKRRKERGDRPEENTGTRAT